MTNWQRGILVKWLIDNVGELSITEYSGREKTYFVAHTSDIACTGESADEVLRSIFATERKRETV